jgi:hypothetical protein
VHDIGLEQKQSSFYFQAQSCENTLAANIVYNIPRAAVNFEDGFGGANVLTDNLFWNSCRESSDHGAFNASNAPDLTLPPTSRPASELTPSFEPSNPFCPLTNTYSLTAALQSWDRMPYVTMVRDGVTPSSIPAFNDVHHNMIVANYAADGGCLDNDDGSCWYRIHDNAVSVPLRQSPRTTHFSCLSTAYLLNHCYLLTTAYLLNHCRNLPAPVRNLSRDSVHLRRPQE